MERKYNKTFFHYVASLAALPSVVGEWKIMDILIKNNRTLNGSWLLSMSEDQQIHYWIYQKHLSITDAFHSSFLHLLHAIKQAPTSQ